jgi:hypothetical protein
MRHAIGTPELETLISNCAAVELLTKATVNEGPPMQGLPVLKTLTKAPIVQLSG